jgi:NRPS condensation-like uncharacterized protein
MDYPVQIFDLMQLLYNDSGFNDHMVHCEIRLDSELDESTLRRATALTLKSIPILATRFCAAANGGRARWEGISGPELERAFSAVEDEAAFDAERTYRIRETEGPQLRVGFLRGVRSAVAVTVNHMIADGDGLKDCAYFLCATYSRLRNDPDYEPPLVDGDRGMDDVLRSVGALTRLRALLGRGGRSNLQGKLAFPLDGGGGEEPFIAIRTIDRESVAALKARCAALGATLNDAVLAAYYRALRRKLGSAAASGLEVPVMVDMRRYLPSREFSSLRNLASTVVTRLDFVEGESFEESVSKIKDFMDGLKGEGIGLGGFAKMSLLASLPEGAAVGLLRRGLKNPLICMTNLGELDRARLGFDGSRVVSAYACGSIKHKPHFQVALSGFDGTITLSSNLRGSKEDRSDVEAFLADVEGELAAAGSRARVRPGPAA